MKTAAATAVALAATLIAVAMWYHGHAEQRESRSQILASTLDPMTTLLKDDATLLLELGSPEFIETDKGILESYLLKIRRDGVAKHADMKQRLDALAENNTAIVTLIKVYAPQAKTTAFISESDKFRNYASAWRDRWNSVMELFMAGGSYPSAAVPFPSGFPASVEAEMAAAR